MITGREAMEAAQRFGEAGDMEGARFWLDFARELREEYYARVSYAAIWKPVEAPPVAEVAVPLPERHVRDFAEQLTGDRTEVLRPGSAVNADGECRHCGYAIRFVRGGMIEGAPPLYVHTRTDGAICPAENEDSWMKGRTYAEPKVVGSEA